jgi:hypothetical protein
MEIEILRDGGQDNIYGEGFGDMLGWVNAMAQKTRLTLLNSLAEPSLFGEGISYVQGTSYELAAVSNDISASHSARLESSREF